jgi:hypothetical protein
MVYGGAVSLSIMFYCGGFSLKALYGAAGCLSVSKLELWHVLVDATLTLIHW